MRFYKYFKEQFSKEVFSRFPAVFIFMPFAVLISIMQKHYIYFRDYSFSSITSFSSTFVYLMIISTAVHIFFHKRNFSILLKVIIWIIALGSVVLSNFYYETKSFYDLSILLFFTLSAFLLKKNSNIQILKVNLTFLYAFIFALFTCTVLFLGFLCIEVSLEYLFELKNFYKALNDINTLIALVLFPTLFLNKIIRNDMEDKEKISSHSYTIIVKNILSPLVFIYVIILYTYFAKIAIFQELPKGNLSIIICLFFSVVLFVKSLLIGLKKQNKLTNFIVKYSTYFTIIPIIFLILAIYVRVSQYGLTPLRYALIACCIWFIYLLIYELIKKQFHIKNALLSLFILSIFSSIAPFNAYEVSLDSQINRLKNIFIENSMYVNNKIIPTKKILPAKIKLEITSILDYLDNTPRGVEKIEKLLDKKDLIGVTDTLKYLNVEYTTKFSIRQKKYIKFSNLNDIIISSKGYDYVVDLDASSLNKDLIYKTKTFTYYIDDSILTINMSKTSFNFDLKKLVHQLKKEKIEVLDKTNYKKMIFSVENNDIKIKIFIKYLYLQDENKDAIVHSGKILLLFSPKTSKNNTKKNNE